MACITKRRRRYVIDFYDHQGKRKRITLKEGTTKKKARDKLREIENNLSRGTYIPEKKIPTFSEVAKHWLEHKKLHIRDSTWASYNGHVQHHFEKFNQTKVNRITVISVEKFIAAKLQQGLSIPTMKQVLITMSQIMKYAVKHRFIDYNPVRDAEKPKGKGKNQKRRIRVLNPVEINTLLNADMGPKCRTLIRLAIFSGAREGELMGLKWSDVEWDDNQIHIQRTYNHRQWYEPKSESSNRKIDLGEKMMSQLRKWKLACPPNELDLIFPTDAGKPLDGSNMYHHYFKPLLRKTGIRKIWFQDFRHTYASLLIEQGEDIVYIQNQMGHADPTVTLKVYAHLMKPANPKAAQKLEKTVL